MRIFPLTGTRVIKTGVAIFLTAWVCNLLNWPPVFAVITAIVTLEPTVSDSIRKGIIRFPASAIGSAYAVFFISLFGNSPITYTLAAVFTIATCYRFKLHAGLLVATLTAVAMIEVIHSNYLGNFFIRLGTTTIGLVVSTFVNFLILPPKYMKEIEHNIDGICEKVGESIKQGFEAKLNHVHMEKHIYKRFEKIDKEIQKTESLIRFQKDESRLHPLVGSKKDEFARLQYKVEELRYIHSHLTNLIHAPLSPMSYSDEDKKIIRHAVHSLAQSMEKETNYHKEEYVKQLNKLMQLFWKVNYEIASEDMYQSTLLPPKLILLYELITLYELVQQFYEDKSNIT